MAEEKLPQDSAESVSFQIPLQAVWKVPTFLTPLIDREREVGEICSYLEQRGTRLITVLGPGGVGKTRVAVQVAQQLRGSFAHGSYFVSLSALQDHTQVLSSIAQALEIRTKSADSLPDQVKAFLEKKACLLILDNFEHLVAAAPTIESLLLSCPSISILVTSRTVLHLLGEQQYLLHPLSLPSQDQLLDAQALAGSPAVALFLQQAQAMVPSFRLTQENFRAVAAICIRLDGLPLAIELATARIKLLPPPALLKELAQRFSLLTSTTTSYPLRQQTLLNTLEWSYQLLTEQEQYLFRLCALFAGGWSLDAVTALVQRHAAVPLSTIETLMALLDNCLLYQVTDEDGAPRLHMLETMQAYGRLCLQRRAELHEYRERHAEYYLSLAEEGEAFLKGPEQILWLKKLEKERENFRVALDWFFEQKAQNVLLRFCRALSRFWFLRGYWNEGRTWMQAALDLASTEAEPVLQAQVLLRFGELALYQQHADSAQHSLEACLSACAAYYLLKEQVSAYCCLSMILQKQGNIDRAYQLLEDAEALCHSLTGSWERSHVLRTRGLIAWTQGDIPQAERCARESIVLARETGDHALLAKALSLQSAVAMHQGDYPEAILLNQEILRSARLLEDKYLLATTLQNQGYLKAHAHDFAAALTLTQQGLALFRDLNYQLLTANTLHTQGYIALHQGNLSLAQASFREGLTLASAFGDATLIGWHLLGLAALACAQFRYPQAARLLGAAGEHLDPEKVMNTRELTEYTQLVDEVRRRVAHTQFSQCWQEGRSLPVQDALSELDTSEAFVQETPPVRQIPALKEVPSLQQLTRRELDVLQLLAQGLTNAQIAAKLVLSARTVNWYLTNIYGKLQVSSRSAATRFALEHNLLSSSL